MFKSIFNSFIINNNNNNKYERLEKTKESIKTKKSYYDIISYGYLLNLSK